MTAIADYNTFALMHGLNKLLVILNILNGTAATSLLHIFQETKAAKLITAKRRKETLKSLV